MAHTSASTVEKGLQFEYLMVSKEDESEPGERTLTADLKWTPLAR